jgi:NADH dehydrogenase FAD-containing subunit
MPLFDMEPTNPKGSKKAEKRLREVIAGRNSAGNDEARYAVADGDMLALVNGKRQKETVTEISSSTTDKSDKLQMQLDRLKKPRAYPIFLAEKAAEIGEGIVSDLSKTFFGRETRYPKSGRKEKIVVLGTGWGAASLVKGIDTDLYDVTVVSPRNYFLFTPMLAGASVGTVEYRSITEPFRELNLKANYIEGTATEIDPEGKVVTCQSVICDGNSCDISHFSVDYDKLVVTIGAQTNTFGIPGVREHCNFLKQVEDARKIRTAIVNCFERANIPGLSDEERTNILTFAVIGAGPTGIEFAAELRDFVEQDGPKYYPALLKYVRIKVIEASSIVLAPFAKQLQEEAIHQMKRPVHIQDDAVNRSLPTDFELVELLLESSVKEVADKEIHFSNGSTIPYGIAVWVAGNGPLPLTLEIIGKLGEEQAKYQNVAKGRIATDAWMRAEGSEGNIIAFGDCSCIIDGPSGPLAATAQVAAQQGEYLAYLLNKEYDINPTSPEGIHLPPVRNPDSERSLSESIAGLGYRSNFAKPFQFLNLGILAYTGGNTALTQISAAPNTEPIKGSGKVGNALWKSVYLSKQVSMRNRVLVLNDWIKRQVFGRDITRL